MKFVGLGLVLLLLATRSSSQGTTCATSTGSSGVCINIQDCPSLLNILKGPRPLSQQALQLLRASQCGFEGNLPKVCCENEQPTETTPTTTTTTNTTTETDETAGTPARPPDVTRHPNLRLLDHARCGPITQRRIFGGNRTGVFDYPWMALVAYEIGTRHEFRCGGTVISKRYVLTAAHCVTALPSGLVLSGVRVGDHDISKEIDCDTDEDGLMEACAEKYQDFGFDSVHYHPEYSRTTYQNDIGLIRLDAEADFRPATVRPICLPISPAASIVQPRVMVTGWGATERGPRSQELLYVFINVTSNDQCAETYRKSTRITYKQICAGGHNRMDSCLGDSGGPLQYPALYNNNPRYVQHGIVSFGPKICGSENFPGVYTRLVYYVDWVLDTMRD